MDASLLNWIIFLPCIGMLAVLAAPAEFAKRITWVTTFAVFLLSLLLFPPFLNGAAFEGGYGESMQFVSQIPWISVGSLNIEWFVGIDGISFPLILLTTLVTWLSAWACWNFESWSVNKSPKGFFALFLLLETGVLGTFCSLDFFLFYIFWEVMLLPMYFLIGIWGGKKKEYAAIKFFLYTLAGSVLMLVALLAMYFANSARACSSSRRFPGSASAA